MKIYTKKNIHFFRSLAPALLIFKTSEGGPDIGSETGTPKTPEAKVLPEVQEFQQWFDQLNDSLAQNVVLDKFFQIPQQYRYNLFLKNKPLGTPLQEGESVTVDLKNNKHLDRQVSAADLLPIEVRSVQESGITYKRRGALGEFYSDNGKRLKIYTDTQLTIAQLSQQAGEELKQQKEAFSQERQKILAQDSKGQSREGKLLVVSETDDTAQASAEKQEQRESREKQREQIIDKSLEKGIDPYFALAVWKALNNNNEKQAFSINIPGAEESFSAQLEMFLKIVGRSLGFYRDIWQDKNPDQSSGAFTPEFVGFFARSFSSRFLGSRDNSFFENLADLYVTDAAGKEAAKKVFEETVQYTRHFSLEAERGPGRIRLVNHEWLNLSDQDREKLSSLSGSKDLKDYDFEDSKLLAKAVFGDGLGAKLLFALDQKYSNNPDDKGTLIKRMVALGIHEGGLKFFRHNVDPNPRQTNIGTFQISAPAEGGMSAREAVAVKYARCLYEGLQVASQNGLLNDSTKSLLLGAERLGNPAAASQFINDIQKNMSVADTDVIAHIGYINAFTKQKEGIFPRLANSSLSQGQIVDLMSNDIQVGIDAIGTDVAAMTTGSFKFDFSNIVDRKAATPSPDLEVKPENVEGNAEYLRSKGVVLFGDSITEGSNYPVKLSQSGKSSEWLLGQIKQNAPKGKIAIVNIGTNRSSTDFASDIAQIEQQLLDKGFTQVVFTTLNPHGRAQSRGANQAAYEQYLASANSAISQKKNVVDLSSVYADDGNMQNDGLHPNPRGQQAILGAIAEKVKSINS